MGKINCLHEKNCKRKGVFILKEQHSANRGTILISFSDADQLSSNAKNNFQIIYV
jgi:hypothetical protein